MTPLQHIAKTLSTECVVYHHIYCHTFNMRWTTVSLSILWHQNYLTAIIHICNVCGNEDV